MQKKHCLSGERRDREGALSLLLCSGIQDGVGDNRRAGDGAGKNSAGHLNILAGEILEPFNSDAP